MSQRLKGKTALITAAGQGIGKAAALAMASEGATQKEKSKRFPLLSPVILLQR